MIPFAFSHLIKPLCLWGALSICLSQAVAEDLIPREISLETLRDKTRGGLLGQILGNLNGLKHEMKYIHDPGSVEEYTPALPDGAWTDDDTDFEWVYILEMQRNGEVLLPPETIRGLWRGRINRRIWCSNLYARQLMDLGMEPPETGMFAFNPWAEFNISGQFLCETFGLTAPGLPQTASRIGLNYTRVAIDLEPAQTTQLFTSMIAMAYFESDIDTLLDLGIQAVDPRSRLREIVQDVRNWHQEHPEDWRQTRVLLKNKYSKHNGAMRDRNGYELNTGVTIAALLYGRGDFSKTLLTAFNFGWDCDNSAATAGTIVGVIQGYRWMMSQGWTIVDRYRNVTRENMPEDETITSFADRILDLSDRALLEAGAEFKRAKGRNYYRFKGETPKPALLLADSNSLSDEFRSEREKQIRQALKENPNSTQGAKAAYQALCLGLHAQYEREIPSGWRQALESLNRADNVLQVLFHHSDIPAAAPLRQRFLEAGVQAPARRKALWE